MIGSTAAAHSESRARADFNVSLKSSGRRPTAAAGAGQ
jgi:hypothetical protein